MYKWRLVLGGAVIRTFTVTPKCHHTQLAKVNVSVCTSYILILHVQTTQLKLKGTAAKFCSANSKAIQQANPTLAPLQLGMVALRR